MTVQIQQPAILTAGNGTPDLMGPTPVGPAESYHTGADSGDRRRQIAVLQQRARALENEIDQRRQLEIAIAERHRAEAALLDTQLQLSQQNDQLAHTVRLSEMFVGVLGTICATRCRRSSPARACWSTARSQRPTARG
jgi:hypothetical protein